MITTKRIYQMLGNESLWEIAARCNKLLSGAEIPYSICGGVAVCLHGYQRNTVDVDLIIRPGDSDAVKRLFEDNGLRWDPLDAEFTTEEGFAVQCVTAGQKAGRDSEVSVCEPLGERNVERIEGLSVVRLSRLIEMKIACGLGNLRRTHKDFADVVELIAVRNLDSSFARLLHKSLRPTYRELLRNAKADESD